MAKEKKAGFAKVAEEFYSLHPQEKLAPSRQKPGNPISVGLPKELERHEKRIMLRPEAVSVLVNNGMDICVESGAGIPSKFTDKEYSDAGAKIAYSVKEVFERDIILKIAPPTLEELEYIKPQKTIISSLKLNGMSADYLEVVNRKKLTALAFELIQDKVGGLPLVRAMSEIAGSTVMLVAAELLNSFNNGKGLILGGITGVPPTKVIILGAGTVAEFAARTAIGLGAEVKIFDTQIYKLRRIKERLGQHSIYTSVLEPVELKEALERCDVVIGAMRSPASSRSPVVVTEEMVAGMKANSVVIDVSIDQGGVFETSEITDHFRPIYRKHEVIHYCVPNIASRVAYTATTAISNIFTPILMQINNMRTVEDMMLQRAWFTKGVYAFHGSLTNQVIADKFQMPCKDLNLILAARM